MANKYLKHNPPRVNLPYIRRSASRWWRGLRSWAAKNKAEIAQVFWVTVLVGIFMAMLLAMGWD